MDLNFYRNFFPKTLSEPRPNQLETAKEIVDLFDKYRYVLLLGPTGAGKTAIAKTVHNAMEHQHLSSFENTNRFKSFYLTPYTHLQEQYKNTVAPESEIYKGRDNYSCHCLDKGGLTCAEGYLNGTEGKPPFSSPSDCPYEIQKQRCRFANQVVCNYSSYLYSNHRNNFFGTGQLMIADEAHAIEDYMIGYCFPRITEYELKLIGWDWDTLEGVYRDKYGNKKKSLNEEVLIKLMILKEMYDQTIEKLEDSIKNKTATEKEAKLYNSVSRLVIPLSYLVNADKQEWFYYLGKDVESGESNLLEARAIRLNENQTDALFGKVNKVLAMSATITHKFFCSVLSLNPKEVAYVEFPSYFPIENRPIYLGFPKGYNSAEFKTDEIMNYITNLINIILFKHKGQKGIMHCTSYSQIEDLRIKINTLKSMKKWKETGHDLIFSSSKTRLFDLKKHNESIKPTMVISPAFREGIDLPDELAEFQIITKHPYRFMSPFIQFRLNHIKEKREWQKWYGYTAIEQMVQACGRGVRNPTDVCPTYVLDRKCLEELRKINGSQGWRIWDYAMKAFVANKTGLEDLY